MLAIRNLPSAKTIEKFLDIDSVAAKNVRKQLEICNTPPLSYSKIRTALDRIDSIIGGFGVELIGAIGGGLLYVNMGDTYKNTVLYDFKRERFYVGNWGSFVEAEPRRFE